MKSVLQLFGELHMFMSNKYWHIWEYFCKCKAWQRYGWPKNKGSSRRMRASWYKTKVHVNKAHNTKHVTFNWNITHWKYFKTRRTNPTSPYKLSVVVISDFKSANLHNIPDNSSSPSALKLNVKQNRKQNRNLKIEFAFDLGLREKLKQWQKLHPLRRISTCKQMAKVNQKLYFVEANWLTAEFKILSSFIYLFFIHTGSPACTCARLSQFSLVRSKPADTSF